MNYWEPQVWRLYSDEALYFKLCSVFSAKHSFTEGTTSFLHIEIIYQILLFAFWMRFIILCVIGSSNSFRLKTPCEKQFRMVNHLCEIRGKNKQIFQQFHYLWWWHWMLFPSIQAKWCACSQAKFYVIFKMLHLNCRDSKRFCTQVR